MKLIMDFYEDLSNHLRPTLLPPNFRMVPGTDPDEIMIRFLNWFRRQISQVHRNIHRSKEFHCPEGCEDGLSKLEDKIRDGKDINPHLSTRLTQSRNRSQENDLMFNMSKVHHFHLGESSRPDGYIERTPPLLFAVVTDSDFYEIDIYDHGGHWFDSSINEIVRENWPELVDSRATHNILGWQKKVVTVPKMGHAKTLHETSCTSAECEIGILEQIVC